MKLFTEENHSQALKILVSAQISGRGSIACGVVSTPDNRCQTVEKLPILQLECGSKLFSSNAASFFLFPPKASVEKLVNKWLDWDSIILQPLLAHIGSKAEQPSKIIVLLEELEKALATANYLVQNELSVADVCVVSTLYPLFFDPKLKSKYFAQNHKTIVWLSLLSSREEFQMAERQLQLKRDSSLLVSVASSCWYPAPNIAEGKHQAHSATQAQDDVQEKRVLTEREMSAAVEAWNRGVNDGTAVGAPQHPVLPRSGEENVLVTSALPYVNNVPHLGNIIGCVLSADVFARYCRYRGRNTLYICGTDEYGTATENKALEEGLTPQQICDKYFAIHKDVYDWFNIQFDSFGRTTTPVQTEIVQELFGQVHRNGYTLIDSVEQLLCRKCDRYLADRFVEGICPNCQYDDARGDQCDGCGHLINAVELIKPRCKQCQSTPIIKESKQIFIDLPKLQEKLEEWVEQTTNEWSNIAKVITKAWLKEGLKPRCITRDLKWGVPVPLEGFEQKVFYVWFDAPIGYMSITKGYTEQWLQWWQPSSEASVSLYQFMAKDNVPFHSIMFPSTLLACNQGYTIVRRLFATEYLNYENGKFSKSRGTGIFGDEAKNTGIPSDIFRFYLLYLRPESQDSNFSWDDLASKNNFELLNNLGNFILRSLSFVEKFFNGQVPPIVLGLEEKELVASAAAELKSYISALEKGRLRDGIKYMLNISRLGNQYMQSVQPWVLVKGDDQQKSKAASAIGLLCNLVCLVTSLLRPYMPQTVDTLAKQINIDLSFLPITEEFRPFLKTGHKIGKHSPLFSKIEPDVVAELKQKYAGRQKSSSPEAVRPTQGKLNLRGVDHLTAIVTLENAIATQGELVRSMKTAGKNKTELKPHIETLLDLKKQLEEFKAVNSHESTPSVTDVGSRTFLELEKEISKQGDKVRAMKAAGALKDELKPEIDRLLELKKNLPAPITTADEVQTGSKNRKNKKKK